MLSVKTAPLPDYSSHRNIETDNQLVLTGWFEVGPVGKINKHFIQAINPNEVVHTSIIALLVSSII